jgi:ankyrin repeat protein
VAVVEVLLAAKAPVEEFDYDGATPLHLAVATGREAVVRHLLAHGAGVSTPSRGEGGEPLHFAALTGHRKVAEVLLDHKADVRARVACNGMTALHLAAARGHADVAELLLARGAAAGQVDDGGWTPLHLAVAAGQGDVVAVLLRHKADPTAKAKNESEATPRDIAGENGDESILKLLGETSGKKE